MISSQSTIPQTWYGTERRCENCCNAAFSAWLTRKMILIGELERLRYKSITGTSVIHSSDNASNIMFEKNIRRGKTVHFPATDCSSTTMILGKKSIPSSYPTPSATSLSVLAVFQASTIEGEAQERSSWQVHVSMRDRDFPARGPRQSAKKSRIPGHLPISSTSSRRINVRSTHFVGDGCWKGRLVVVGR